MVSGLTSVCVPFSGGLDGAQPYAGVTLDNAGHLYGTTSAGGADNYGVVFAMAGPGIPGPTILHAFAGGSDGQQSFGSLVADASGNLYGVTWAGGAYQAGTVFEMTRDPVGGIWSETVLYEFRGAPADGANPYAGVTFDSAGNLYGTTYAGGTSGFGTVFKLTPNQDGTWSETVLHSFAGGNDGGNPYGGITLDALGNLYGTTNAGGPGRHGTIFKMAQTQAGQWSETVLYGFTGGVDGGWPDAGIILDGAGNLYGTAVVGGLGGPRAWRRGVRIHTLEERRMLACRRRCWATAFRRSGGTEQAAPDCYLSCRDQLLVSA